MLNVESDLEQLEFYLDNALDGAELAALQNRLKADADFARSLAELKSQRAVRSAVWLSMEGDAGAVGRLQWRVRGAILQETKQATVPAVVARNNGSALFSPWRMASVGSAAAACLVLGFFFGRLGHSSELPKGQNPSFIQNGQSENVAQLNRIEPGAMPPGVVAPGAVAPGEIPVVREAVARTNPTNSDPRAVPITDAYGRIVAWQHFATPEEASSFAKDLHGTHPETSSPVAGPSRLATQEQ